MSKRQLAALFVCSLVPWVIGNGLLPLLPVYARQIGASPALVGYYLSISYMALAIGTMVAGWLSDRFQKRKRLILIANAALMPGIWLMGQVSTPWQLIGLTSLVWFTAGISLTLYGILAGLFAAAGERGRVFGILALTSALGALIGGMTVGGIADRWGFPTMFIALALFAGVGLASGIFLEDKPFVPRPAAVSRARRLPLGRGFYLLIGASVVAGTTLFIGRLATSLAMNELGFLSTSIAGTAAVGGLVTLPLSPLLGRLSDRVGREILLIGCYIAGLLGLLALALASNLAHFWLAAALLSIALYVGTGIASALAADLVPKESLGKGISTFSASNWIGGIVGFALAGSAIQAYGARSTLITAAGFLLAAIFLLGLIRQLRQEVEDHPLMGVEFEDETTTPNLGPAHAVSSLHEPG